MVKKIRCLICEWVGTKKDLHEDVIWSAKKIVPTWIDSELAYQPTNKANYHCPSCNRILYENRERNNNA